MENKSAGFNFLSGCMGIYLDAIDAVPDKETVIGSRHAFMMTVMGKMLDYLQTCDLAKIKGALERRHICDGVILEGFRNGKFVVC